MKLNILNETESNIIEYLPYGVTTVEMKIDEIKDAVYGILYPKSRGGPEGKLLSGNADGSNDFLIIWGGGKESGLHLNSRNVTGRLFLQIIHMGNTTTRQSVSLMHNKLIRPINNVELVPIESSSKTVRMTVTQKDGNKWSMSFEGSRIPSYYERWFPRKSMVNGNKLRYYDVNIPSVEVNFRARRNDSILNVDSDIEIFFENKMIAKITGDWKYSWPHAELFSALGDTRYLVLRVWLYWIHKDFSRNIFYGGEQLAASIDEVRRMNKLPQDEQTRLRWWESFDIECPDIERFDFLIDTVGKKINWVGTDFHYQESWYKFDGKDIVKARIANDVDTIGQVFRRLKDRFSQPEQNYNPFSKLKEIINFSSEVKQDFTLEAVPKIENYVVSNIDETGDKTYLAEGFTRKHVPYCENGKIVAELISSVVTS